MARNKDLQGKLNNSTDFLSVLSVGGVLLSGILLFSPVKAVGYIGVGASSGAFAASVVTRKKHWQIAKQELDALAKHHQSEMEKQNQLLVEKDDAISTLRVEATKRFRKIEELNQEINQSTKQVATLQNQVESLTVQNQRQRQTIERVTEELDRLIRLARTAVEESLDEWNSKLSTLVSTKKEQYPKLVERLSQLLDEGEQKLCDYAVKLASTPTKWDSLADLLSLYYCINDDMQNIKIKAIQAISRLTIQEKELEIQEVDSILEEWQSAKLVPREKVEHLIKNYEAALNEFRMEFSNRFDATQQLAITLRSQSEDDDKFVQGILAKMKELEAKIYQLSKPIMYLGATRTDMRIANIVIGYFEQFGIILDRAGTDFKGYEATLEFITDRTGRLVLASELNDHSERLQGLTHVLNSPEFKLDPETGLMTLLVRWAKKPATDTSNQAKRLISPLDEVIKKLVSSLSHKPTVRVMGATGEGKGVMVRYLLNSILASNLWYCRIHDPQHASSEDYWGVSKVSKSGRELQSALKGIESQLVSREANKNWKIVTLDVLDEIDTHLDRQEKREAFIDLISRIRHCGMKLVLIGQNPKVGRAGFEWSDMQQMNCIYMGASALDAIEANPQLKVRKDKLIKDYLTLAEYYESANEGLSDSEKYLFGLVVIPGKTPAWIELPRPDSIQIDCPSILIGESFNITDSFLAFVRNKNYADIDGNPAITDRNSTPSASAESLMNQGMPAIADTPNYVEVAGTVGISGNGGKATCKKHSDAELRPQKDGRYYCPSCKKRLAKSEVEYQ